MSRRTLDLTRAKVVIALPVLLLGGTEIQVLGLVSTLRGMGCEVLVCCYFEHDSRVAASFEEAGAAVRLLGLDRSRHGGGLWGLLRLVILLRGVFLRERPRVVHVQYLAPGFVPILAARLARVPCVFATVHAAGRSAYGMKATLLLRAAALLCDRFICVSRGVERFWFGSETLLEPGARPPARQITVYNGVDVAAVARTVDALQPEDEKKRCGCAGREVVGSVGRLAHQKGLDTLLRAMVMVTKRRPGVALLVVGDGPELAALQERARRLEVDRCVVWHGAVDHAEAIRLYAAMDVLAMPSRFEGFGLTAVEAMAAGLPVVATSVEGLAEIVSDGETGYLVPVEDPGELAAAIVRLLESRPLRRGLGAAGRARAGALFSRERFERCVQAVYAAAVR